MARAGPVSSGGGGLGPARIAATGNGWGCFRIYRWGSMLASRLGSCDRRHKLPSNYPLFFGHRVTNALSCVAVQPPAPTSR
jgi:hypothetical protein